MNIAHAIMLAALALADGLSADTNATNCTGDTNRLCLTAAQPSVIGFATESLAATHTVESAAITQSGESATIVKAANPTAVVLTGEPRGVNLLKNSSFTTGTRNWRNWQYASLHTNWVGIVTKQGSMGSYRALRIASGDGSLVGIQQDVPVMAGGIYKLAGSAQSMGTNSSSVLFGGRIGFLMRPQPERQLVWTTEFNQWWRKYIVFTNRTTGTAQVFIHMGYGHVASTGEFADVRLERVGRVWRTGE